MTETKSTILKKIESTAASRGEDINTLMDGPFGQFWAEQYYKAEPDVEANGTIPESSHYDRKSAPVETSGFILLQARARELIAKDRSLTEPMAISKACEMYPDLVESHEQEMRGIVA